MTVIFPTDAARVERQSVGDRPWPRAIVQGGQPQSVEQEPRSAQRQLADLNKYDLLMLGKGFALVKTHRTSSEGLGEITATLDDGTTIDDVAFNDSARYIMDFTTVAQNVIAKHLGKTPAPDLFLRPLRGRAHRSRHQLHARVERRSQTAARFSTASSPTTVLQEDGCRCCSRTARTCC